jgi:hypothetical protein
VLLESSFQSSFCAALANFRQGGKDLRFCKIDIFERVVK